MKHSAFNYGAFPPPESSPGTEADSGITYGPVRPVSFARALCLTLSMTAVSACDGTIHRSTNLGGVSVLSLDARQRIVVVGKRLDTRPVKMPDGTTVNKEFERTVICAEPSPDAIVAQATILAGRAGSGEAAAAVAAGLSEGAGSIGLRTQSIQLLRDGYYRICEAYLNGAISDNAYKTIVEQIDQFMIVLVAIEAVTGVVVAPAVTVSPSGQVSVGKEGDLSASSAPAQAIIKEVQAKSDKLSDAQVAAVTSIVHAYLRHRN